MKTSQDFLLALLGALAVLQRDHAGPALLNAVINGARPADHATVMVIAARLVLVPVVFIEARLRCAGSERPHKKDDHQGFHRLPYRKPRFV
jgi:hypothetical protein